jgi:taurine dioxygenase
MSFTVSPLSDTLGAEIVGLDLSRPIDTPVVEALRAAFHEHLILLFRGQDLTWEQQVGFAGLFGPLGVRKRKSEDRAERQDTDHMMLITNIREDGKPIGSLPDGEMLFHHDMCYVSAPDMATLLYAIEPTRDGGNTVFANMHAAYETLADDLKTAIEGREVLQIYNYIPTLRVDPDDDREKWDHYVQPAVIVHPVTGRKALYVNQLMSARIEGLPRDESDAVLAAIREHLDRPELSYAHAWRPGDLMMWDNYCTCHARTDLPPDQTRLLRRCTVAGEVLIPA